MSEDWDAIAAEVSDAIGGIGFASTLRQAGEGGPLTPGDETPEPDPVDYDITVIDDKYRVRDASGTLIAKTQRTLTIGATGVVPTETDVIAVGVAKAAVGVDTVWITIMEVRPLSPGGVDLLYEIDLESSNT